MSFFSRLTLSPNAAIDSGDGPTKMIPAALTASAKLAFSDK